MPSSAGSLQKARDFGAGLGDNAALLDEPVSITAHWVSGVSYWHEYMTIIELEAPAA